MLSVNKDNMFLKIIGIIFLVKTCLGLVLAPCNKDVTTEHANSNQNFFEKDKLINDIYRTSSNEGTKKKQQANRIYQRQLSDKDNVGIQYAPLPVSLKLETKPTAIYNAILGKKVVKKVGIQYAPIPQQNDEILQNLELDLLFKDVDGNAKYETSNKHTFPPSPTCLLEPKEMLPKAHPIGMSYIPGHNVQLKKEREEIEDKKQEKFEIVLETGTYTPVIVYPRDYKTEFVPKSEFVPLIKQNKSLSKSYHEILNKVDEREHIEQSVIRKAPVLYLNSAHRNNFAVKSPFRSGADLLQMNVNKETPRQKMTKILKPPKPKETFLVPLGRNKRVLK